ncbi:MAG: DUF6364 family protein, partial [Rhodomicrobium sp.]
MKNVTLSVEEDVLAAVRKYAAARNTTVNGLVRDYLGKLATQEDRAAQARKQLVELAQASTFDPGTDWKWNREELYDRHGLSRHQHSSVSGFAEPGGRTQKDDSSQD